MTISQDLKYITYSSVFVALIAAGAFLSIPIGPVPIVLQNMFVLLAGITLGPKWGLASVAIYILIGICGLPVFAGGKAGIGVIFGPTGGYLLGYLPAVFLTGLLSKKWKTKYISNILALIAGSVVVYAAGVPWLKIVTGMSWEKSFTLGMYPFIPGDVIKIIAATILANKIKQYIKI